MPRSPSLAAGVAALALAACETPSGSPPAGDPVLARGDAPIWLVTFRPDVDVAATAREMAGAYGFQLRHLRQHAAPGFSAVIPERRIDAVRADPRVLRVERDGPVGLVLPRAEAGRPGTGQTVPWGITRVGGPGDGTGLTAWVIDTGIDLDHPDLNTSKPCHANFVTQGVDNGGEDGNGHGTHVAGTIAALDNGIDVVGVAAGAYVCSVRVLAASGFGTWEWVTSGVDYVAANGASGDVANMSLSGPGENATLEQAILDAAQKGILFTLAAGNDGDDAANHTPARLGGDSPHVYTVSAIARTDCLTSWSNYGADVDFAAPGSGVLSTRRGGGTTTYSGTSMAAPHVAGILLLGRVHADGAACGDPDGDPDPIAHF